MLHVASWGSYSNQQWQQAKINLRTANFNQNDGFIIFNGVRGAGKEKIMFSFSFLNFQYLVSNRWHIVQLYTYDIVFVVVGVGGDIAIDDITVSATSCEGTVGLLEQLIPIFHSTLGKNIVSVNRTILLEHVIKMRATCFDADFISQLKLTRFPLILCFITPAAFI